MDIPDLNTAKGLATLVEAQLHLIKIGEATGEEFNWENILKEFADNKKNLPNKEDLKEEAVKFALEKGLGDFGMPLEFREHNFRQRQIDYILDKIYEPR